MVLLEFSMAPLGKGESVGDFVAKALEIIDSSGLPYQFTSMGTIIEGEWDQVFNVVKKCFEEMKKTCPRITCHIKVDYREGTSGRIRSKTESVEKRLGKKLST